MNCTEAEKHLPDFLAGDLAHADHAALQAHLEGCPACAKACADLVEMAAQLDRLPVEKPSPALRERFYAMLGNAVEKDRPPSRWNGWLLAQAAATLLLVGGGFLAGYWVRGGGVDEGSARNQNLVLMHQGGAGLRMAGVMLASQGDPGDPALAEALLDLLDRDPSESVRLAAVDALYLYGRQARVRERLAASLARQTSPRVQVALVDLLGGLREQRALEALRTLLRAPGTTPEVARRAKAQLEGPAL
jgi:hypothetical protein